MQGLETPAAASGFQPNTNMGGVINTTSNGLWTFSVANAAQFQVYVDTPGSFTGTANVGIRCSPATFQQSNSAQVARNVTVVSPTDGSGYVNIHCQTGCAGGQTWPSSTPGNAQLVVPANASAVPYTAGLPLPVTTPAPVGTIGAVLQAACVAAYPCGYPTPIPFPWPTSATTLNLNVSVCSPGTAAQCAAVNGSNELSTFCVAAQYPCGFPTPVPTVAPIVVPTATAGATVTSYTPTQAYMNCVATQSTGVAVSAGNGHAVACESHAVLANGLCTTTLPCVPAIGDTSITCSVTTTKTQCIAAPSAGQVRITALQALGEESATGGIMELVTGTGTNCGTPVTTIPILAIGASFTANQQVTWGNGVGTIIYGGSLNEICVLVTAGTITTASITFTYTVF